jgi:hypothetical protein
VTRERSSKNAFTFAGEHTNLNGRSVYEIFIYYTKLLYSRSV